MTNNSARIRQLYLERPKSYFLRLSSVFFLLLLLIPWCTADSADLLNERRKENLFRFLGELVPYPLQGQRLDIEIFFNWAAALLSEKGAGAMLTTFAISVAAIVLAGLIGGFLSFFSTRTLMCADPFLPSDSAWLAEAPWRLLVFVVRTFCMFVRAVPEYVWAFIFLMLLGPSAWPAVLALAVHNAGILGKLNAEVMENLDPRSLTALRALGASRAQIAVAGLFPRSLGRFLLFFFYRWEMCVRESTVLGLLGIVSLGYWIQDARARNYYDEMFFFIVLGAFLVFLGDLISAIVRESVRRY